MLVLASTNDKLQIVLGGAVTTNQLQTYAAFRDITTTAYTPGQQAATSNSTTDADIVAAPGASTQRVIDYLSVYNADTVEALVTVKLDVSATETILFKDYIQPGKLAVYTDGAGWSSVGGYKPIYRLVIHADAGANFAMTNATQAERFAGNSTRTITVADLAGYTQVRLIANVMVGSASANTPKFRVKYYTTYSTTVGNYLQLGSAAQVEVSVVNTGYLDTGWLALASGAAATGVYIAATELGGDAAADPALGYTEVMFR